MKYATVYNDVEARVSFETEINDYGYADLTDIIESTVSVENLRLFGVDFDEAELRAKFGNQGYQAFLGLIIESIEEIEV